MHTILTTMTNITDENEGNLLRRSLTRFVDARERGYIQDIVAVDSTEGNYRDEFREFLSSRGIRYWPAREKGPGAQQREAYQYAHDLGAGCTLYTHADKEGLATEEMLNLWKTPLINNEADVVAVEGDLETSTKPLPSFTKEIYLVASTSFNLIPLALKVSYSRDTARSDPLDVWFGSFGFQRSSDHLFTRTYYDEILFKDTSENATRKVNDWGHTWLALTQAFIDGKKVRGVTAKGFRWGEAVDQKEEETDESMNYRLAQFDQIINPCFRLLRKSLQERIHAGVVK